VRNTEIASAFDLSTLDYDCVQFRQSASRGRCSRLRAMGDSTLRISPDSTGLARRVPELLLQFPNSLL